MDTNTLQNALAFGEIDIRGANDARSVCLATTTYALL